MILFPAIDIQAGRCVQLVQGDFDRATVFGDDPVAQARTWAAQGAAWLHVVDLDAARGTGHNRAIVAQIARAVSIPVQLGGGLRDEATLREVLDAGVARAVLGTAAVESPDFARAAIETWGERVAIGIDARGGQVAVRGWVETADVRAVDLATRLAGWGARRVIYTDIERDGTLTSPNYGAYEALLRVPELSVIASGGIASLDHLRRLRALGTEGAIIGTAIYTGAIDLRAALLALARED